MIQVKPRLHCLLNHPYFIFLKWEVRRLRTLFHAHKFQAWRQLSNRLPLAALRKRNPYFLYRYLGTYISHGFSLSTKYTILRYHYEFLELRAGASFFTTLYTAPVLWSRAVDHDILTISLSYSQHGYEEEFCLKLSLNSTVLQVVGFVIAPGPAVGAPNSPTLLFSHVQGKKDAGLLKYVTRILGHVTPAIVLVNAAYGLAAALGIRLAAGVSNEHQVSGPVYFDYSAFWRALGGQEIAGGLFHLPIPAPEKPITQIPSNRRSQTLRQRHFKQCVRKAAEKEIGSFLHPDRIRN